MAKKQQTTAIQVSVPQQMEKVETIRDTLVAGFRMVGEALTDAEHMAPAPLAALYKTITTLVEKNGVIETLKKTGRSFLLPLATEKGQKVTDAGTMRFIADGWEIEARPRGRKLIEENVMALVDNHGLKKKQYADDTVTPAVEEQTVWTPSEEKLRALVVKKVISQAEFDACFTKDEYNLFVNPAKTNKFLDLE